MSAAGPRSSTLAQTNSAEEALVKKARAIHEKVITLDTHIDFLPADLVGERNYTQRLDTQFNLPNMIDGGLNALSLVFMSARPEKRRIRMHSKPGDTNGPTRRPSKSSTPFTASPVRSRLTRSN